jgi:methyl-accepting chemotaxis protein
MQMAQATLPPAASPVEVIRPLKEAIDGLRHSQNILVAAIGLVAALFLGALVWLASDINALRQQVGAVETRMETSVDTITARIDTLATRTEASADAINARIDNLNSRVDSLVAAVGELRAAIGAIDTKLDDLSRSPNPAGLPPQSGIPEESVDKN